MTQVIKQFYASEVVPTLSLMKKYVLPNIKRVDRIQLINRKTGAVVTKRTLTHSLNSATQELTVSGTVDYTDSRTETTQSSLSMQTFQGDTIACLYRNGSSMTVPASSGCPSSVSSTSTYYYYDYVIVIDYTANTAPGMTVQTGDNLLVREGEAFPLRIEVNELDTGDVVDIQYFINGTMTGSLGSFTSESIPLAIARDFQYQNGRLTDPVTGQSIALAEGQNHTLRIEARDNFGGIAPAQTLTFTVDTNIPPVIVVNPLQPLVNALSGDSLQVSGNVSDPNGDTVTLTCQLNNGPVLPVLEGAGGPFEITLFNSELKDGDNLLRLIATDQNGEPTEKRLNIRRDLLKHPLLRSEVRYRLNMPSRTAREARLKIMREAGDLTVTAQVSMTNREEDEKFVPMIKANTVPLGGGMEEDEFRYTADAQKEKVTVWITMTRTSPESTKKVLRVSGELHE